jgi:hypothetical protein
MKKQSRILVVTALIFFTAPLLASLQATEESFTLQEKSTGTSSANLRTDMRTLWIDHVVWTRNVIFCIMDDLPGTDQAVKRLLKNQHDIGDAIGKFYGAETGKTLTELLETHITIAADLLKAAKKGDDAAHEAANKKWSANADEISAFLAQANPHWKLEDMKKMMHEHLELTHAEAVARLKKDYDEDVKAYEKVQAEILEMADMLSDGILKQFPEKFQPTGL